jgi:hypothetical protein
MRRTTVTLDADVEALLERAMRERGVSFKEALNQAIRAGLTRGRPTRTVRFRVQATDMGLRRDVNIDKALSLAAQLEDEAILRKLMAGK